MPPSNVQDFPDQQHGGQGDEQGHGGDGTAEQEAGEFSEGRKDSADKGNVEGYVLAVAVTD